MPRTTLIALLTALTLILSACGGDTPADTPDQPTPADGGSAGDASAEKQPDAAPKKGLAGRWKIVEAEGEMAGMNKGTIYTLTEDGKITVGKGAIQNKGAYTREGATIKYDLGGLKMEATIALEDDDQKLIWKLANSDQVFTLTRD